MNRIDYMMMVADCMSEEDCYRLFHVSRDAMESGKAVWNYELEYAYNEFMSENEMEDEA